MKRSISVSDFFYRISHTVRRNRFTVIIYALICVLFLVVGVAVGINIADKRTFILNNGAAIYGFLRGSSGIITFFFVELSLTVVYCLFAASMFFNRPLNFLSVVPCAYRSYVLGMNVSVIIVVYSVSALPMLFVLYIPTCIVEIAVLCFLSFRCFCFTALNCGGSPSKADLREYYSAFIRYMFVIAVCVLVKAVTLALFGSALVGIV